MISNSYCGGNVEHIQVTSQQARDVQAYLDYYAIVGDDDGGKMMSEAEFEAYKDKLFIENSMKMINKKIGILITGLLLSCSHLFAIADGIINFDIRPEFGILHGSINEYVFEDACKNTDNLESRLDWDVTAIPYIAGAADITILRYIFIGVNGRYGFPITSGNMQDYDWLNSVPPPKYSSWLQDDPTELTNYSKHNNFLDSYYGILIIH